MTAASATGPTASGTRSSPAWTGAPAQSFPNPPYTNLASTPVSREKPYLTLDAAGQYSVFVPAVRTDSAGTTWENGPTAGRSIPLSDFFVARPADSVKTINSQLARGKNLLLTPGVYDVDQSIEVKRANTVVLGLGMATLTAVNGAVPLTVADVPGVDIAGRHGRCRRGELARADAHRKGHESRGRRRPSSLNRSDPANPTTLHDVFFRIGGPHVGKATLSLEVNSDNVLLDHIWAWRADHGNGVGWTTNTADNGVIVNGDNVTATGLFVEHYQQYNVIWNGEHGRTVFFQNELPYDAPNQAAWQHDGVLGWAGYKVADSVQDPRTLGRGQLRLQQRRPDDPRHPGLRSAGHARSEAPRPADRQPRRRDPGPRRQRHRRAGLDGRRRGAQLRRQLRLGRRRRAGHHVPPAGRLDPPP